MNKYAENMTTLVTSFKDNFKKDETPASIVCVTAGNRVTKLTKPAKVLTWLRNMSLETFIK